jgi:hypothetical protein
MYFYNLQVIQRYGEIEKLMKERWEADKTSKRKEIGQLWLLLLFASKRPPKKSQMTGHSYLNNGVSINKEAELDSFVLLFIVVR